MSAGYSLARGGTDLVFRRNSTLELHLTVPGGGTPTGVRVGGTISGVVPFPGATLDGTPVIDQSGLTEASATVSVDPTAPLPLGPLRLAEVAIGTAPARGARVAVGLAPDANRAVRGVLHLAPAVAFGLEPTGGTLADLLAELVLPPAVDLVLSTNEAQELLGTTVLGGTTIKALLRQVVFTSAGAFDPGVLDPANRLLQLAANIAARVQSLPVDPLTVKLSQRSTGASTVYGIAVSRPPGQRFSLASGDVTVDVDSSWISGPAGADGLVVELLQVTGGKPAPYFGMDMRGRRPRGEDRGRPWIPAGRGGGRAARLCGPRPQRRQHQIGPGREDTRQRRLPRRQSGLPVTLRYRSSVRLTHPSRRSACFGS